MNTRQRANWEDLMGSFDTGRVASSPAIYEANVTAAPMVGVDNTNTLLALCMNVLQQQGFTISGTTQTIRYTASSSSYDVEQTSTQFSFGPDGESYEETRQRFTLLPGPGNSPNYE